MTTHHTNSSLSRPTPVGTPSADDPSALWAAAARCHVQSDNRVAAAACLARAGRLDEAAAMHESERAWLEAARCYEATHAIADAGRCYQAAQAWADAVRCYRRLGQWVDAAWIESHELGHPVAALQLLAAEAPVPQQDSNMMDHARTLVQARCAIGFDRSQRAAEILSTLLGVLESEPAMNTASRLLLRYRAVSVADALGRPDLAIQSHVALTRAGDDLADWQRWSIQMLGEFVPLPRP